MARVNWNQLDQQVERLGSVSGGRAYAWTGGLSVPPIYDDIMEHLRVRYVITYVSSQPVTTVKARLVQVRLVNPSTSQPLQIADANGRPVKAHVIAQGSYTPAGAGPAPQNTRVR